MSWWPKSVAGAVASVFGRTGAVVAAAGDYTAAQVTNAADKAAAAAQTFTGIVGSLVGAHLNPIVAGALPPVAPASGVAFQCSSTRDVLLVVPITATLAAGTCVVALSPDNVTFSNLVTMTPGIATSIDAITLQVPAGWWVRLTVSNATIGTGTYY